MKPDVIFKLERGEAPWIEDGEVPSSDSAGECKNQADGRQHKCNLRWLWGGISEMCCAGLLSSSLNL